MSEPRVKASLKKGYIVEAVVDGYPYTMDHKVEDGGHDKGTTPGGLLLASLAGCKAMVAKGFCEARGIPVEIEITTDADWSTVEEKDHIHAKVDVRIKGDIPEKYRKVLAKVIDEKCTVASLLQQANEVTTSITYED